MTDQLSGSRTMASIQVARPETPQEVLALLRGVNSEADLKARLARVMPAATDPAVRRYELHEAIGQGSQGTVWAVADRDFLRPVAIKTMHERDRLPEDVSRFIHEAQITAQLEHPGVVPVHDLQVLPDGTVFYVMKRIEGATLADHLPDPSMAPGPDAERARLHLIEIVLKILDTLAFAHSRGVIHRDLKPKNIMIGRFGEVLVLDWGLAKIVGQADETPRHGPAVFSLRSLGEDGGSVNATGRGCAVGTPAFMSPEQALGRSADPRSDLYGIGVILYHILCGVSPYDTSAGSRGVLEQAAAGHWTPLEERPATRGVPRRLLAIVSKAMALKPEDRYQSAEALAADLRSFLAGEAVAAYREAPIERLGRLIAQHQRVLATGMGVALLAGCAWGALAFHESIERQSLIVDARAQAAAAELKEDWDGARRALERLSDLEPRERSHHQALERVKQAMAARRAAAAEIELQERKRVEAAELQRKARMTAQLGGEEDLAMAKELCQMALGLTPGDPALIAEYDRISARLTTMVQERERIRLEVDRSQRAEALRMRSARADKAGDLPAAVSHLESALALEIRPQDTRLLSDLVQRRDAQERARQESVRRAEADTLLARAEPLLTALRGREAREILEQARGIDPANPGIPALDGRIAAAERSELEQSARGSLNEASGHLEAATGARDRIQVAERSRRQLADLLAESPTDRARAELERAEAALDAARRDRATSLAAALAALHQARTRAPWYAPVNGALADYFVDRLLEAETEGQFDEAAAAEAQARHYDDGSRAGILAGEARLDVVAGSAPVRVQALVRGPQRTLVTQSEAQEVTPGTVHTLTAGRWLLSAGPVVQAIWLRRGEQRRLSMTVVPAPAGTAVVPGQPGVIAPFAIGVTEVTCGEWLAFINDAAVRAEISAAMGEGRLIRLPRASHTSMEPLWRVRSSSLRSGGGHQVESTDGRAIDPASPVTGISAEDARAYAAWRATREGRPWRLPTLAEWRWAVGGGDGRLYPWGDAGDLGLCASAVTCAGLAQDVLPSVGSHPTDRSVQGVLDLAGSVAEFVDAGPEVIITVGGVRLTPLMGGSRYENQAERFTCRHRRDMDPRWVHPGAGFRLAQDL